MHLFSLALILFGIISGFEAVLQKPTPQETESIKRLRHSLRNGEPYTGEYKDYMKEDDYLLRFLRDRNFNVTNAKNKIMQTLKWRKENRIEETLTEKMGDMEQLFPYEVAKGFDLAGNPLLTVPYGTWNVRRFMIRGNGRDKMKRYSAQLLERGSAAARKFNAPWGIVIMDLNGYNAKQHGCAACIPFYYDLLTQYEGYYPAYVKNFNFINTPRIWEQVSKILLPLISPLTRDVVQIFGYNKKEWQDELLKHIHPSQLTPQFGGTRKVNS